VAAQKKSQIASERDEGARGLWRWFLTRFDPRRLVFVDESGTHISMDRLRARAPRGQRAYGKVPRSRGKNLTLIASMSLYGMGEAMCILRAPPTPKPIEVYVEHFLAPTLQQGQVVVFDNLGAHKPRRVRELIEARGAEVLFLPSYSPDLNPIEEAFSKIKGIVRKLAARTHEALTAAIAEALSFITPRDAAGWFTPCGYEVEVQYL
jgi:transposase